MNLLTHAHAAIIHFPIAFLLFASACGLYYLLADGFQQTTWTNRANWATLCWIIWASVLIGWLGGVLAVFSGLVAQSNLPPGAPYQSILNWHTYTGFAQLLLYGGLLYWRWRYPSLTKKRAKRMGRAKKETDIPIDLPVDLLDDRSMRWPLIVLFALGAVLIIASGWNGGRLVYEWGVNVRRAVPGL